MTAAPGWRRAGGPRHRHSPRVRRLAREAGVDPDTLTGTGPGGRVRPQDVPSSSPGAPPVAAVATSTVEVDLTRLLAALSRAAIPDAGPGVLLAASAADALLGAVRRHGLPGAGRALDVVLPAVAGEDVVVPLPDAADLSRSGLVARLCTGTEGGARTGGGADGPARLSLTVCATDEAVLLHLPALPDGAAVAVALGPPVDRAVVVRGPDGPGIAVRPVAVLATTYDASVVSRGHAVRLLTTMRDLLERPDAGRAGQP